MSRKFKEIEITESEVEVLCELIFLGNWLVNSHRLSDDKVEKYQRFAEKIEGLHRQRLFFEKNMFCKDMVKFYFDKVEKLIDEYDKECCSYYAQSCDK